MKSCSTFSIIRHSVNVFSSYFINSYIPETSASRDNDKFIKKEIYDRNSVSVCNVLRSAKIKPSTICI